MFRIKLHNRTSAFIRVEYISIQPLCILYQSSNGAMEIMSTQSNMLFVLEVESELIYCPVA